MIRNHKKEPLTLVMRQDRIRFPKNRPCKWEAWGNLIREYVEEDQMYVGQADAFNRYWEEYVACEKRKLKRRSSKR